eukprot:c27838_g1_i4 orf=234-1127(+)
MATVHGPAMCAAAMRSGVCIGQHALPPQARTAVAGSSSSNFVRGRTWGIRHVVYVLKPEKFSFKLSRLADRRTIQCNSSMSSDNNGSTTEGFSENDADYINSSVIEAVSVKSGFQGLLIKMKDGQYVKCVHNNPDGVRLPGYAAQPAIVLKMEDGSNILLPIVVLEFPCTMLMEAVRNVHVHVGDSPERVSLDLRPSDAINIAIRCQAPIQVNRQLAYSDGVKIVSHPPKVTLVSRPSRSGPPVTELDRPQSDLCVTAKEFVLVRSIIIAAIEERYTDAARLRDELKQLRTKSNGHR